MKTELYRITGQKRILVHNDLENTAYYFKSRIEKRMKEEDVEGIAHERMACMIALAFSFEAYVNFIGYEKVKDWKEFRPLKEKATDILETLKIEVDWTQRPFLTVLKLKKFRDLLAHGKPIIEKYDKIIKERGGKEEEEATQIDHPWEASCRPDAVFQTYGDIDALCQQIREASGILITDMQTNSESSIEVVSPAKKTR